MLENLLLELKTKLIENVDNNILSIDDILHDIKIGLIDSMTEYDIYKYFSLKCESYIGREPNIDVVSVYYILKKMYLNINLKDYTTTLNELIETKTLSKKYIYYCIENMDFINSILKFENDNLIDFFGLTTLESSYLLKNLNNIVVETPQHMFLRESIQVNILKLDNSEIYNTYFHLSNLHYTHATPTLFNSGTIYCQLSSCYLLQCGDSMDEIKKSIGDMMSISKWAGGIGINLSDVRGKDSKIKTINGKSDGIIPLCKMISSLGRYVNQGGKRNGAIAVYLEPWHADIFAFCDLRRITGDENERTRDLFLGLWIPDLFMKCVQNNDDWYLMTPDVCNELTNSYGEKFEEIYYNYVKENKYVKKIKASELYTKILESQCESGMPYMLYKDACNKKSNQKNLGTIKNSNLCSEIIEYSSNDEIAVCNLASISLPRFVKKDNTFDFELLGKVTELAIYNLNTIIDVNFYPLIETEKSNLKHRPIGLGVQGLIDVFQKMDCSFDSEKALNLNKKIFECIYFHSIKKSIEISKEFGAYDSFNGSPFSQGILQFHMWDKKTEDLIIDGYPSFQWEKLIEDIQIHGIRNSLLTSVMPTGSTSQIMGNYECVEPYASNILTRKTGKREFTVINKNLISALKKLNLWNYELYLELLYNDGSVQKLNIPKEIKNIYKTSFELKQKFILQQSIDRGPFIDHSQSLNIFMDSPDQQKLTQAHFYGWRNGIKTGMYYLRTKPAANAIKFGIDAEKQKELQDKYECKVCSA